MASISAGKQEAQIRIRVAQQQRQRAKGVAVVFHVKPSSIWMGMVRRLLAAEQAGIAGAVGAAVAEGEAAAALHVERVLRVLAVGASG